jgi:hypothetical protein
MVVVRKIHSSEEEEEGEGAAVVAMGDPDVKTGIAATMTAARLTTSRNGYGRMVLQMLVSLLIIIEGGREGGAGCQLIRDMAISGKKWRRREEGEGRRRSKEVK